MKFNELDNFTQNIIFILKYWNTEWSAQTFISFYFIQVNISKNMPWLHKHDYTYKSAH